MEKNTAPAIQSLTNAQKEVKAAEGFVLLRVLEARKTGASWAQIGEALEMTKQAAQQKFGPFVKTQLAAEARWDAQDAAQPSKLVDDSVAGTSVTPSIFLDPLVPANDFETKLAKAHAYADKVLAAERMNPRRKSGVKKAGQIPGH